ncbi:MAG: hypothetical protein Q9209_006736 [Squamulea sp. 1 TL-2023]
MPFLAEAEQKRAFIRPALNISESSRKQSSNVQSNDASIRSLLDLVDFDAIHNPDHVFCLQEIKTTFELRRITYRELATAVEACTIWLSHQGIAPSSRPRNGEAPEKKPPPVALLMGSDITLLIYLLALMRLGIPVALFSARLSPYAIAHLIEKVQISSLVITSHTSRSGKEAINIVESRGYGAVLCVPSAPLEYFVENKQGLHDGVPPVAPVIDEFDRNAIILHSSGSTGLPKPIYHAHKYLLNYATCHKFQLEEDTSQVCTSTLPLFHVGLPVHATNPQVGF